MAHIFLADRVRLLVSGKDADDFLQSLITTDLASLPPGVARAGALLTPQGKILFDFLISKSDAGFSLETHASQRDALIKRLTMYKLRAEVSIASGTEDGSTIVWDAPRPQEGLEDERFSKAGLNVYRCVGGVPQDDASQYDVLRIKNGIAESGSDFALSDAFPHDVLLDLNAGVSFKKGCYVGQEVVSRMQHRSTARRRIVIVHSEAALPGPGNDLMADGKVVGTLGTTVAGSGLALVRIDKVGDAMAQNIPITAGGIPVNVSLPGWTGLVFPTSTDEATA